MKAHFKKSKGKWLVFECRSDESPVLIVSGGFRAAIHEWDNWLQLCKLTSSNEN